MPCAVTFPSFTTKIWSLSLMVESLCATDEQVVEVTKKSGCYEFIMQLENGFDTVVGGAGGHLSGGERQRISIARAMLKDAPIVILDEATAYTDPENEATLQNSIAKLVAGKTLIVIAHRLSTIKDSDQIFVTSTTCSSVASGFPCRIFSRTVSLNR